MKKRIYLLLGVLFITQCSLINTSRNINDIREWVDAKVGDERIYEYIIRWFDPDDHSNAIDSVFGEMCISVDSTKTVNDYNDIYYDYFYITNTTTHYDSTGYIDKTDSHYSYIIYQDSYYTEFMKDILKAPVEIGQYWHNYVGINCRISEINATRETEAGVFHDVIVMTETYCADTIGEVWYSPSVGDIIKHIDYGSQYFTSTYNYELVKFDRE